MTLQDLYLPETFVCRKNKQDKWHANDFGFCQKWGNLHPRIWRVFNTLPALGTPLKWDKEFGLPPIDNNVQLTVSIVIQPGRSFLDSGDMEHFKNSGEWLYIDWFAIMSPYLELIAAYKEAGLAVEKN